ncbi:MAG: LptF/LptG family permease [Deltaproteobacteria bacterium]|nr:LptF/LptG family permease [Deltaproteobacteria bacterium]
MIRGRRTAGLGRFAREVASTVALHVVLATISGALLFSLIDLIEVGNIADRISGEDLWRLSLVSVPRILRMMMPIAAPLGTVTAIGTLVRRREIEAFFAAGAHPTALLPAVISVGLVMAVLHAANQEWLVPPASSELSQLRRKMGLTSGPLELFSRRQSWIRGQDLLYRVHSLADRAGRVVEGVLILRLDQGRLVDRWDVERLEHHDGRWIGREIVHRIFGEDGRLTTERIDEAPLQLGEEPRDFVTNIAAPDRLSLRELAETTERRARLGRTTAGHVLELHRRAAVPLGLLLAMALAAALGLRLGRQPSLARALGVGSLVGLAVWVSREISSLLGETGALPAGIAGWNTAIALVALAVLVWARAARRGIAD